MALHPWGIFEDYDQAVQHIGDRYVIYNKKMYQVRRVYAPHPDASATVALADPANNMEISKVSVDDPLFNGFKYDPLGWVNTGFGARLTELIPVRQTRRGYGEENVGVYEFGQYNSSHLDRPMDHELYSLAGDEGFTEMLRDIYPEAGMAMAVVFQGEPMSLAISRSLCLQSDNDGLVWLWRYGDRIAILPEFGVIRLGIKWKFLQEELQECGTFNQGVLIK